MRGLTSLNSLQFAQQLRMGTLTRAPAIVVRPRLQPVPSRRSLPFSGPCYGGGVGLALSCDFRVADPSAYFAIPAARLSNVYGIVETRALFDAVGLAVAKEVLFTGRRYNAEEAMRLGLATHTADGTALQTATDLANSMRASAPLTIKGSKVVLEAIARNETEQRKAAIDKVMDEAMASADYREGGRLLPASVIRSSTGSDSRATNASDGMMVSRLSQIEELCSSPMASAKPQLN